MQPAQRRRWRLAKLLPVSTGHPAHMGEAEIESDIDDACIGRCRRQPRIELGQAKIEQHLRDRHPEMALKAELQRADADAGGARKLHQVKRIGCMRRKTIPRPPQRLRQCLALAREGLHRLRQTMTLSGQETIEQSFAPVCGGSRRERAL